MAIVEAKIGLLRLRGGALSPRRQIWGGGRTGICSGLKIRRPRGIGGSTPLHPTMNTAVSFNGRTALSKSANVGPIPTAAAIRREQRMFFNKYGLIIYRHKNVRLDCYIGR